MAATRHTNKTAVKAVLRLMDLNHPSLKPENPRILKTNIIYAAEHQYYQNLHINISDAYGAGEGKGQTGGARGRYSSTVLADTGARMSLLDRSLAEKIKVEYTGREISFISISGRTVKASEAIIYEFEVEGEMLKYEVVAVADIPEKVKETLRINGLDENVLVGVLTLERANMIPDTTTGTLKKAESFILSFS